MKSYNWRAPILPYIAVCVGLFVFKNAWAALLGFHAAILIVLACAKPKIPIQILFRARSIHWLLLSTAICATSGIAIYYFHGFFGLIDDLQTRLAQIGLSGSAWFSFIAYFSLVNPFVEEYFWRAYLGSDHPGLHIGDFVYAGYHALILIDKVPPLSILFGLFCLTCIGWYWRRIGLRDGGLLAPAFSHLTADFSILTAVYLLTR